MVAANKPRAAPRARPKGLDGSVVDAPEVFRFDYDEAKPAPGKRLVIFSVNGKDYTAPANPPAGVTLAYLDELRANGGVSANAVLLDMMLGADGYAALRTHPTLQVEDLNKVIGRLTNIVVGKDSAPKDEL
jgi:hypothetical protein